MALQNAFENLAVESKQDTQITKLDIIISNQLPDDHNVTISNQIDTSNLALNSTLESVKASIDSLPILPDNHSVIVSNIANIPIPDVSGLATKENQTNGNAKNMVVDLDGHIANVQAVTSQIDGSEYGMVTNAIIHGKDAQGNWHDVKTTPSGAINTEGKITESVLPTGASTSALQTTANTKLDDVVNAVENLNINLSNQGYAKVAPTAYTRIHGTYISGDIESVKVQDNRYLIIQELSGDGLTVDFDFVLPTDKKAEQIVFKGQYNGSNQHWCDIYAYDWQQATYVLLTNSTNRFSSTNEDITVQLDVFNNNFTDAGGNVKIRVKHNTTTYINTHQLQVNYVHVAYLSALDFQIEGIATEETLAKTVKTMFIGDVTITPSSDATNDYYVKTGTTNTTGITTQTITINKTTGIIEKRWS